MPRRLRPPNRMFLAPLPMVLLALLVGCQSDRDGADDDRPPIGSPCSQDVDCKTGRRCIAMHCQPDYGDCRTDNDCINDTYCACPPDLQSERCACVPWGGPPRPMGYDPKCRGSAFKPEEFKNPILKCQWPPPGMPPAYKDTLVTPVVVDLEGDGQPEIVFAAGYPFGGHLIALSGKDCSVKWDRAANVSGCMHLAAADLDGDGKVEIIANMPGLAVFDSQGMLLASTTEPGGGFCARDYPPAIANLDGGGDPEIIAGAAVFRFSRTPTPTITRLWNKNINEEGTWAIISIAQDLDGDGKMEVIAGHNVYDGITGADKTVSVMKSLGGGYPAIGDFNGDGKPDIVLVSSRQGDQKVSIIDYANNRLIMPETAAQDGWGGPPTVADFDGDGRPELATASAKYYYVYSPDCLQSPLPRKCEGTEPGVLWQSGVQDDSSGSTGSSVFDFNGDGISEVVYRDECWLRVYDGRDGTKLFAAPVTSGTDVEMPVIADTDGDGHAEIVVTADSSQGDKCRRGTYPHESGIDHPGVTYGLKVYVDPENRWMPSRKLWNQHSYHITNINDDGTIPTVEPPNYKTYNNYRQNVQGSMTDTPSLPDATSKIELPVDVGDCVTLFRLSGVICNRGALAIGSGYPGTFYLGDPRRPGARAVCTAYTDRPIQEGQCQPLTCEWKNPSPGPYDLWLRADDDGTPGAREKQCKDGNDVAHLDLTTCMGGPG